MEKWEKVEMFIELFYEENELDWGPLPLLYLFIFFAWWHSFVSLFFPLDIIHFHDLGVWLYVYRYLLAFCFCFILLPACFSSMKFESR